MTITPENPKPFNQRRHVHSNELWHTPNHVEICCLPTETSVALELCDHILKDGFDCNNAALFITMPADLMAFNEGSPQLAIKKTVTAASVASFQASTRGVKASKDGWVIRFICPWTYHNGGNKIGSV